MLNNYLLWQYTLLRSMAAPTSYMYQMPYGTSAAHLPYLSTHPQLSASAAAAGYSPADFTTAAAYTASAFPGATTFDPYTMAFSAASLPHGYNYAALTHAAAAANAAGSFPISAAYPTAAAPQPALQEARMQ